MRSVTVSYDPKNEVYKLHLYENGECKNSTPIFYDDFDQLGLVRRMAHWMVEGK